MRWRHGGTAILCISLLLAGCGDSPTGPGDSGVVDEPGIQATYAEGTVVVDSTLAEAALQRVDSQEHRYTFDADMLAESNVALDSGDVLVIAGVALRKVRSVREEGGELVVDTEYATLPEAFEQANIQLDEELSFTSDVIQGARLRVGSRMLAPDAVSATEVSWEYEVEDYTISATLSAQSDQAELEITVARIVGGRARAAFTTTTTFEPMRNRADIRIEDSETKSFDYQASGMGGTATLTLAAAGAGSGDLRFIWPEAIIRFPVAVGPVPIIVSLKAGVVTRLRVEANASAQAETRITYDGDAGFQYDGTEVSTSASANLGNPSVGESSADAAALFGQPVDAQFGVTAPIIELGLFGETVIPFVRPEFYVGSRLTWGPVCKRAYVRYLVKGGLDLRILGVSLGDFPEQTIAGPYEITESGDSCEEDNAAAARSDTHGPLGPAAPDSPFTIAF